MVFNVEKMSFSDSLSLAYIPQQHKALATFLDYLSASRAFQLCRRVHLDSMRVNFKNSSEDKSLMDLHGKTFARVNKTFFNLAFITHHNLNSKDSKRVMSV